MKCYCVIVILNRLVRLVPRDKLFTRKYSVYSIYVECFKSRRVCFLSHLARPSLGKHNRIS